MLCICVWARTTVCVLVCGGQWGSECLAVCHLRGQWAHWSPGSCCTGLVSVWQVINRAQHWTSTPLAALPTVPHTHTHTKWCVPLCFPSPKPYILPKQRKNTLTTIEPAQLSSFAFFSLPFFCIPLAFFHLFLSLIALFYSHPHVCFSLVHFPWLWLVSVLKYPQTSSLFFVYSFLWKYRISFFFSFFFQTALRSWFLGLIHHEIPAFNEINSNNRNGNKNPQRCTVCGSNTKSICVPLYLLVSWQLFKKVIWQVSESQRECFDLI